MIVWQGVDANLGQIISPSQSNLISMIKEFSI